MSSFESLALALRGHFHKPLAQLPPDIQQRILADFAPWPWDNKSARARRQLAKQWDFENDPATRENREGIEALTNPDSPAYSPEETQRLRGDFLPEPRNVQPIIVLPPLELEDPQPLTVPRNVFGVPLDKSKTATSTTKSTRPPAPCKSQRRGFLTPFIATAQRACADPYDTPSVWAKLREMAMAKTAPFLGATDEGLQWIDGSDQTQYLSLRNLRERLNRQKNATD
jgi:hypothetical protein